ncbi:MAG: NADH-quinone oxidoreductase subunit N [Acidobacteria bacterium RIFCSPLOWO2_12_FULL_54_10]|nr:MAG: NADH-quinone oxidoreductase subunit N [Acidobacteria bacterium RIFCSPLOWO2_12_FULL_54_10]
MNEYFSPIDFLVLKPVILLTLFGIGVMLTDLFLDQQHKYMNAVTALVGLAFAAVQLWLIQSEMAAQGVAQIEAFRGAVVLDRFAIYFSWIFLISSAIAILIAIRYLEIEQEHHGEHYAIMLFAAVGMMVLVMGMDLVTLFIALELMVLSVYILTGFLRRDRRSNEAALKYLLLGAFSSGILAYGMSLLYGMSGSTNLNVIADSLAARPAGDPLVLIAITAIAAGLFFKVGAVPFHQWLPDAYEGAPTSVTAFMSVGPKAASFAFLLRMFLVPLGSAREEWLPLLVGVSIATMTLGNLAAISQSNVKRLLAYSAISHAGYLLLGLVSGNETGMKGIAIYFLVYTFMNMGAFAVIVALRRRDLIGDEIDDMAGLMYKCPTAAVLMLIFLLSLAGIPPTAGFLGKYFIFLSLIETGHITLAVIAVLYVAVALYYYFRIVAVMFMREPVDQEKLSFSPGIRIALGVTAAMTILIGLYPEPFIQFAGSTVLSILR